MRFQPSSELSTTDGRNSRDSNNGVRHQRALSPWLSMMMMMMVVECSFPSRLFQMSGAATRKLCRPSKVLVRGTNISPRPTEGRLERHETSDTGIQTSLKYAGPVPQIESKTVSAILNSIHCGTGSQWRTSRMAGVMWSYLPASTTKWAAAFSTICSGRVTCEETP